MKVLPFSGKIAEELKVEFKLSKMKAKLQC